MTSKFRAAIGYMRSRHSVLQTTFLLFGCFGCLATLVTASAPTQSARIARIIGELKHPDGAVFELWSAPDKTVPDIQESAKILSALATREHGLSVFAKAFPRLPIRIEPFDENDAFREFYIHSSAKFGDYQVGLAFRVTFKSDLSAVVSCERYFGATVVPADIETRIAAGEAGNGTPLKTEEIEDFAKNPKGYLQAHVPSDPRLQSPPMVGIGPPTNWATRIIVKWEAVGGILPIEEKLTTPTYPWRMRHAMISGDVTFEVELKADGNVTDFVVIRASQREFVPPVEEAVKSWKFKPEGSSFGERAEIHELLRQRSERRPERLRGTIVFSVIEE